MKTIFKLFLIFSLLFPLSLNYAQEKKKEEKRKFGVLPSEKDKKTPKIPGGEEEKKEEKKIIELKEPDEKQIEEMISFKSNFEKDVKCIRLPPNAKINIDFDNAPLEDITKFIACIMERNFILTGNLKGKQISIMAPNPVTVYEAYKAFLSALDVNGLTIVPSGKFYKIIESPRAKGDKTPILGDKEAVPDEDRIITRLVALKNIDAKELEPIITKFKSTVADITTYVPTNTFIITDTASNIKRLLKFIEELDVPIGKEKIWIRPVIYAVAGELINTLNSLFGEKAGAVIRGVPPQRYGGPSPMIPESVEEGVAKISKIIADDRTNQLILVATPSAYLKVDRLIRKLDVPIEGEGQIHIYYLENADAEELSSTLSGLTQGMGARGKGAGKPGGPPQPASLFEGEVKITAHKPTNALVIESSLKDYLALKKVIQQLDIRRKQVYVEAVIMEISSNKERKFGISGSGGTTFNIGGDEVPFLFGMGGLGISSFDMQQLQKGGLAIGLQGPLLDVSTGTTGQAITSGAIAIPSYGFLIQAIQSNSDVNILSTPHILAMDNEDAEIVVGKQIPYQAQSYGGIPYYGGYYGYGGYGYGGYGTTTTGTTTTTPSALAGLAATLGYGGGYGGYGGYVQRIDVDITLKITPQISESNYVKLKIEQSVEDVESMDVTLGPTTSKRKVTNTVVVKDQQPVVIGGLIRDTESDAVDKIPFIGDIPVFGIFFRKSVKRLEKRNLLMVITPYIIEDPEDLKKIHERKMEEIREFAEYLATKKREYEGHINYEKKHGALEEMRQVIEKVKKEKEMLEKIKFEEIEQVGPAESHDLEYDPFSEIIEKKEEMEKK